MVNRPARLIGVLGTHTEVGKTFVAARWLALLRQQGLRVAARKPAQSFDAIDKETDADRLSTATGELPLEVCPAHRHYPLALAPPMAAEVLRRPRIALAELVAEVHWPRDIDVGIVETAGGPRSPIAHDGDSVDLLRALRPDAALLVADAGLGTLNAIRLSLASCTGLNIVLYLNRYDDTNEVHRLNRRWLIEHDGIDVYFSTGKLASHFGISPAK